MTHDRDALRAVIGASLDAQVSASLAQTRRVEISADTLAKDVARHLESAGSRPAGDSLLGYYRWVRARQERQESTSAWQMQREAERRLCELDRLPDGGGHGGEDVVTFAAPDLAPTVVDLSAEVANGWWPGRGRKIPCDGLRDWTLTRTLDRHDEPVELWVAEQDGRSAIFRLELERDKS